MYRGRRVILIAPAYNEDLKIGSVVSRTPRDIVDKVLVVDDGSTDQTAEIARDEGAEVISLGAVKGVGYAIREGYRVARQESFDIAVVIAGNNKDSPEEITRLLDPICDDAADFVMGSRYLAGGRAGGDMPLYRKIATRLHPFLTSLVAGRKLTESSNGYRAVRVPVLESDKFNLNQGWLDHYELEVYLLIQMARYFRYAEVPVSKIYPSRNLGNTKMRPFVDWWKMLRPIISLGLGLKR